ncbi:MAG: proprotein convertase P-domain-containing protein [Planctomycetes bacterium]|nr:proprotein convertase P-domain-containing protein [Planctomycetota bacterium]
MLRPTSALLLVALLAPCASAGHFTVSGPGGAIPDFVPGTGTWNVAYTGTPFTSTVGLSSPVTSVTALHLLGFQHSWRGDLHILLKSPSGAAFNVVVRPGSDGWTVGDTGNYLVGDYTFVDTGGSSVQQGTANLQPGTYDVFQNAGAGMWTVNASNVPLSAISGPAGLWRLEIRDWAGSDVGALAGWTLEGTDATPPIASFCAGDGSLSDHTTPCPCGNDGSPGKGCANSVSGSGAVLGASGQPALDTVVLSAGGMPSSATCVFLQGDALADAVFGDGVRCAGGVLLRLRTRTSTSGSSTFPNATDTTTLAARGQVAPGSGVRRYYQTYYRNASATFCPPETFNVTNGLRIDW